jgi:hypothetical protein
MFEAFLLSSEHMAVTLSCTLGAVPAFFSFEFLEPKFAGVSFLLWQTVSQELIILLWRASESCGDENYLYTAYGP